MEGVFPLSPIKGEWYCGKRLPLASVLLSLVKTTSPGWPRLRSIAMFYKKKVTWLCVVDCYLLPCYFMPSLGTCSTCPLLCCSFGLRSSHPPVPFLFKSGSVYWTDLLDEATALEESRNSPWGLSPWVYLSWNYSLCFSFPPSSYCFS